VALAAAWWLAAAATSGPEASLADADGGGIASALGAVATTLADKGLSDSAGGSASSRVASVSGSASSAGAPVSPSTAPEPRAPRPHLLAVARGSVGLSEEPGGPVTLRLGSTTEFGSPRVLAVAARRGDWLGVVTTEQRNNRLAWVRRESPGLELRRTRSSLHADLSERTLTLRKDGRRVHRMPIAVGRPGSETPTGRFAVTDKLSGSQYGPYYGCCILALSGHQPKTPPGWTGGDRLAIHGTDVPSTIGTAASAGCLRASDADLRRLMAKVRLGTTLFVRR
jgi:L,D-transpeptidase catalytic domain